MFTYFFIKGAKSKGEPVNKEKIVTKSSSVGITAIKKLNRGARLLALAMVYFGVLPAMHAQFPAFLWRTNVGASFFAVDAQTNVYLNNGSTIITLNSAGVPVQTNIFNQPSSIAQRDAAGNYYFAGQRPGVNAGAYLLYGTTNACFLTKYTAAGTLVWSNGFGPTGQVANLALTDLQLDTNGNAYVGYAYNILSSQAYSGMVAKLDNTGASLWNVSVPIGSTSAMGPCAVRLTVLSPTNGLVITYANLVQPSNPVDFSGFDDSGNATIITNWNSDQGLSPALSRDSAGSIYTRERTNGISKGYLTKRDSSGAVFWQIFQSYLGPVGVDPSGGVYASEGGSGNNTFSRYDTYGNQVWRTNFPGPPTYWSYPVTQVFVDASGNRFVTFSDGSIARIGGPALQLNPQSGDGLGSGGFQFTLLSDLNASYEVRYSSNSTSWYSLGRVTNQLGHMQFLDSGAINASSRFYMIIP
jgi:hypothetical protein